MKGKRKKRIEPGPISSTKGEGGRVYFFILKDDYDILTILEKKQIVNASVYDRAEDFPTFSFFTTKGAPPTFEPDDFLLIRAYRDLISGTALLKFQLFTEKQAQEQLAKTVYEPNEFALTAVE